MVVVRRISFECEGRLSPTSRSVFAHNGDGTDLWKRFGLCDILLLLFSYTIMIIDHAYFMGAACAHRSLTAHFRSCRRVTLTSLSFGNLLNAFSTRYISASCIRHLLMKTRSHCPCIFS